MHSYHSSIPLVIPFYISDLPIRPTVVLRYILFIDLRANSTISHFIPPFYLPCRLPAWIPPLITDTMHLPFTCLPLPGAACMPAAVEQLGATATATVQRLPPAMGVPACWVCHHRCHTSHLPPAWVQIPVLVSTSFCSLPPWEAGSGCLPLPFLWCDLPLPAGG